MGIDFDACDIRIPRGRDLAAVYQMLMEAFPTDRPVIEEHLRTGRPYYTLRHHSLFRQSTVLGREVLGNVGLMPMRVWLDGGKLSLVGIAAVATPQRFRRQGVAGHLLEHCLAIADRQGLPSVLYTDSAAFYARRGFVPVEQTLLASSAEGLADLTDAGGDCRLLDWLSCHELRQMSRLHGDEYPKFDGTLDREEAYWPIYGWMINLYPKCRVLFYEKEGRLRGFVRCEQEIDRLLVTEVCYDRGRPSVVETLLSAAGRLALGRLPCLGNSRGSHTVTLALPKKHPAWSILRQKKMAVEPEAAGVSREVFMVRPAPGKPLDRLAELQWSMADKF